MATNKVRMVRGTDLHPEPIDWLWPGNLARGKFHMVAGAPGTGKTTLALAILAAVTRDGGRLPDGHRCKAANVLVWSGEDDPADTLLPRFLAMGGDASRIYFVDDVLADGKRRPFDPSRDMDALAHRARDIGDIAAIMVDPVVNAVAGDSHKNVEVRRGLQPTVDLAAELRAAVVGISHFSKGTAGRDPVDRVTGSVAFGALPRVVFGTAKRTEEQGGGRVLVRAKSNIGPDGGGFVYELHQVEVPGHPGLMASRVEWGSPLEGSARELLADVEAVDTDRTGKAEAMEFLAQVLAAGRVDSREVKRLADAHGLTPKELRAARYDAGVVIDFEGFGKDKRTFWRLPISAQGPIDAHKSPHKDGAHMGTNGAEMTEEL